MKILHIIAVMPPESGIAAVVTRLALEQQRLGHEVAVASTVAKSNIEYSTGERGVRVVTFRRSWPHFLYFSWGMLLGFGKEIKDADVVHVHSSWTFPVWWGAWLALQHNKTLVMSPHGSSSPLQLKHSAWKKRLVGWLDKWLLQRASVIHAMCEAEKHWIQAFVQGEREKLDAHKACTKIVVIPNGVC
ncbi:MAG: glycosyltransferase [bacterium]